MTRSYVTLRPATLQDFREIHGPFTPGEWATLKKQVAQSPTFTLARVGGKPFCAGGFWPNPKFPERIAWMLWADHAPPRPMVEGVREIIEGLPFGPPINAYCDAAVPQRRKYLELVGFRAGDVLRFDVSSAPAGAPTLPAEVIRMEWP